MNLTGADVVRLVSKRGERIDLHLPMDVGVVGRLMMAAAKEGFDFERVER